MSVTEKALDTLLKTGERIRRYDGWQNILTGFGTSRDKVTSSAFVRRGRLNDETLEALFQQDDLARTIVTVVPDFAMREGFKIEVEGGDDDAEKQITRELRRLDARQAMHDAAVWGRLFGGAAVWVVIGEDQEVPLLDPMVSTVDPDAEIAAPGEIQTLRVVDKRDLAIADRYSDPLSPNFGRPEFYDVTAYHHGVASTTVRVHETRLIMFGGALTSEHARAQNNGWDDSVLTRVYTALRGVESVWDGVVNLMTDASQAVLKIKGLIHQIGGGLGTTELAARFEAMDLARSIARAILVDSDQEDFKYETRTVAGIGEVLDKSWLRLAAAARLPVTILLGQAPAGLNATGAIDLRWFYDTVRASQSHELEPRILRLAGLIAAQYGVDPEQVEVEWPSLWQMTDEEKATMRKIVAETDAIYIDNQVVLPEEVTLSRYGSGAYSIETDVDIEVRRKLADLAVKRTLEDAEKPTPEVTPEMLAQQNAPPPPAPADAPPNPDDSPEE